MAAGILLALRLKLQDQAAEDMYTEKALAAIEKDSGLAEADRALRRVLQLNSENEAAMLLLARRESQSVPGEEGRELYQRLIRQLLETSPERAAEVFVEYFSIYKLPLAPDAQYRLTFHLRRGGWTSLAAHALECIVENPATLRRWAELCLLKLGQILEELCLPEAARFRYEQLLKRYPDFSQRELVQYKIKRLTSV
jgi:TolA-binding protein